MSSMYDKTVSWYGIHLHLVISTQLSMHTFFSPASLIRNTGTKAELELHAGDCPVWQAEWDRMRMSNDSNIEQCTMPMQESQVFAT